MGEDGRGGVRGAESKEGRGERIRVIKKRGKEGLRRRKGGGVGERLGIGKWERVFEEARSEHRGLRAN